MARCVTSAVEGEELGLLRAGDKVAFHARAAVHRQAGSPGLHETGYRPPMPARRIRVAGDVGIATFRMLLVSMLEAASSAPTTTDRHPHRHRAAAATWFPRRDGGRRLAAKLERKHFVELAPAGKDPGPHRAYMRRPASPAELIVGKIGPPARLSRRGANGVTFAYCCAASHAMPRRHIPCRRHPQHRSPSASKRIRTPTSSPPPGPRSARPLGRVPQHPSRRHAGARAEGRRRAGAGHRRQPHRRRHHRLRHARGEARHERGAHRRAAGRPA